jgi:hypothetical protein
VIERRENLNEGMGTVFPKNNVFIFRVLCSTISGVLWASAAQLMSQQAKSLKELTTSTYVV